MTMSVPPGFAQPIAGSGELRAGVGYADITPNVGVPLAGYSTDGFTGRGIRGHLFVRVLYIEDAHGGRVAFCALDLHSATRYLLYRVSQLTASIGVGVEELFLVGTHSHSGPGNLYGNSLYDKFSQGGGSLLDGPRFNRALANWIAEQVASAVRMAVENVESASVGVGRSRLWGVARNRSLRAFRNDTRWTKWNDDDRPGARPPNGLSEKERATDPRVTVLAAFRSSGSPIGVIATFGCHSTALGRDHTYSADWPGWASKRARALLEGNGSDRVMVAVTAGAAGDQTAMIGRQQGRHIAEAAGHAVADAIVDAIEGSTGARADARRDLSVRMHYTEGAIARSAADYPHGQQLAAQFLFGASTLAGSEDGRSQFYDQFAWEGMKGSSGPLHSPKAPALGGLGQKLLRLLLGLSAPRVLPLHVAQIGDHAFLSVPGEPTAQAAFDVERALRTLGSRTTTVIGYGGEYAGYFTTIGEYRAQHYEGASTIFGIYSTPHLVRRFRDLAHGTVHRATAHERLFYTGGDVKYRFVRPENARIYAFPVQAPFPLVDRTGRHVEIKWLMHWNDKLPHSRGWMLKVERWTGGAWRTVEYDNRPFTDIHPDIELYAHGRLDRTSVGGREWDARIHLPPSARGRLRVVVPRWGNFEGFATELPPP